MKIRIARITKLLANSGFTHYGWGDKMAIAYGRPMGSSPMVEWIQVGWAGKEMDAFGARAGVSATKCVKMKGLQELERITPYIAPENSRGLTIIETTEAARAWEDKLVEIAPDRATAYAKEYAPILLQRTEAARSASNMYLEMTGQLTDPSDRLVSLKKLATAEMRREAERLAGWPGVLQVVGAQDIYAIACLAVVIFQGRVEENGDTFFGHDPLENMELMWRIQLIADHLLLGRMETLSQTIDEKKGTSRTPLT